MVVTSCYITDSLPSSHFIGRELFDLLRLYYSWLATVVEYKQDTVVYEVPASQIRNYVDQPTNARYFIETSNQGSNIRTATVVPTSPPEVLIGNQEKNVSILVERHEVHGNNLSLKFNARYCDVRLFTSRKKYDITIDGMKWSVVTEKVYGCPQKTSSNLIMFSGNQCKRFTVCFLTEDAVSIEQIKRAYQHLVPTTLRTNN